MFRVLKDLYLGLKFSFSYFSILPISFKNDEDLSKNSILKYMMIFFPFVGLVLSSFIVFIHGFFESSIYLSLMMAIFYMISYGFIHTEAIADVVDAIYAKHSNKDPYKVIKEPTIGAMGLLYTVSFLILKIASLSYILYEQLYVEFIIIAIISRVMVVLSIKLNDFKSSFVTMLKSSLNNTNIFLVFVSYSLICLFLNSVEFILLFLLALLITMYITKRLKSTLGFLNGDVLGFNLEINELLLMIITVLILI